jgi:D-methionine transport system ATP-binding protein
MEGARVTASVRLEQVSKAYGSVRAVDDVSLTVERGSIVGVIGYSGAGKSTLVRLINGLERPTSGRVFVGDDEITALSERRLRPVRRGIGMIFQQFNLFRSRTVAGNVGYPLRVAGVPKAERDARIARLLDFVGLLEKAHAYPEQLSGGQKQRVGIARALATDPHLLLADEATSALDPETTADVLALLQRVNRELGVTIVLITHEMEAVRAIADRVVVMDGGRVVEQGALYDVFASPSSPAATRFVRGALHDRPSPAVLQRIRAAHAGRRIVTVAVTDRPGLVGAIATALSGVDAELVHGGIGDLGGRSAGALTYALHGSDAEVEAAFAALAAADLRFQEED